MRGGEGVRLCVKHVDVNRVKRVRSRWPTEHAADAGNRLANVRAKNNTCRARALIISA